MEDFIKTELQILEDNCKNSDELEMQQVVTKDILDIYNIFKSQQHSGSSAAYILGLLDRLLRYIPVTPLTGEDTEWNKLEYMDDICYQNKRCPQVFKDSDGKAYNVEGKAFSNDNGHTWYTNKDSRVYITFPYTVPIAPEYIIIDNKQWRDNILAQLVDILVNKGFCIVKNSLSITEDNILQDIMLEKDIQDYLNEIQKQYDIHEKVKIDKETPMWSIVSYVLENVN